MKNKEKKPSHIQFANIIEKINEGFVALDAQMNYTYINERGSELLKRKPEDLIGKNYWDEYPEDKNTSFGKAYLRALKTQTPVEVEDYYAPSDRWFENRIYPSDEGLSIFFNDITDRKRAEQALIQKDEQFRRITNVTPTLFSQCSSDLRYLFVNRAAAELLGFPAEEIIGKPIRQVMGDAAFEVVLPYIERVLRGERVEYETEIPYRLLGPRFMHVVYVPEVDDKGTVVGWIATVSDITERKQAEARMRQSEERFRQAADAAGALVYEVDLPSGATAIVHGMESIVGYDSQNTKMTSEWWHSLIHPEDLPVHLAQLDEHLVKGDTHISEYRVRHKNGGWITVQDNRLVIRNDSEQAIRLIGAVTDISERKRNQLALTEFARQQEALYQLTDRLQGAKSLQDIFNAALDAILRALQCERASILLFDHEDVMRFVAWRGLSDDYRKATNGHSPWKADEKTPEPISMNDVATAELSDSLRAVIEKEGIGSLAFIPLVFDGKLIGKFMTYFNEPHIFSEDETELSLTIARQLAIGIDRIRDENALRTSEERLRLATQAARMFTWEVDIRTRVSKVSDNFAEAMDFSPGLIPKDNEGVLEEFIHPEDTQVILEALTKAVQSHISLFSVQYRILNPENGQPVWLDVNGEIVYDLQGNPERMFGVAQNITESKQGENRLTLLAEVSELLRNIEDPTELTFAVSKAVGEHLHVRRCLFNEIDLERDLEIVHRDYCNDVESVAGEHKVSDYSSITSAEVAAGKTVVNTDSKTDVRTAADYERSYAPQGERAYIAVPLMRENRWVASLWVSDDVPRQWGKEEVSLLETIAERTWTVIEKLRIAQELRAKEAELQEIINQTPFMLTRCSRDLRYQFVSRAYAELVGRTPEEIAGKSIVEVMGEEGLKTISPYIEEVLSGNQVEYEAEVSFSNISVPFLHVVYTPDRDEEGNVIGWFASIVDITERKRIEDERNQLLQSEQAQRADAEQAKIEAEQQLAERKLAEAALGQWADTPLVLESRPLWIRYGIALVVTALSILLRLALQPAMGDFLPLATIYGAVAFSVWFGGIGPALLSAVLGYFGSAWFIIEPHYAVVLDTKNIAGVGLFLLSNTVIIALGQEMRRAQRHAHQSARVAVQRQHQAESQLREKQLVAESLRQSEELYRGIARSIPGGGVYVVDKGFQYIVAEGPVTEAFGLSREVIEGKTVSDVFPKVPAERMEARLRKNFAGETVDFETEHNGRFYWTQQAPMMDSLGNVDNAIIVTIDITERKQVEEALKESERKFSLIFHKLPFAAALSNPVDGVIADVNEAFERIFGYSKEEVIGKTSLELGFNPNAEARERILTTLQEQESVRDMELELFTKPLGVRIFLLNLDMVSIGGEKYILQTAQDITERKQSEEALRRSEERFVRFMQHLPGLAWIKDVDGRYIYANAAAEKSFNTPRENLYGRTDEEIFPPEVAAQFSKNDQLALMDEKGVQVTETLEHEDGVIHYSLVNKFPIPGPDGNTALIGGTAFDITERKQAEEALRESEARLRAVFDGTYEYIGLLAPDGTLLEANRAALEFDNNTREDVVGRQFWETPWWLHTLGAPEALRDAIERAASGEFIRYEAPLNRRSGETITFDFSLHPIRDEQGKVIFLVPEGRNITDRKQAEEALRESEERFRAILKQATAGIVRKDVDGRFIFVNEAFCNMLGYTETELLGRTIWEFTHKDDLEENKRLYDRTMVEGIPFKLEKRLLHKDGSILWVDVSVSPVKDATGTPQSAVAIEVDITRRKEAEESLHQLNLQLESRVQRRTGELQAANQSLRDEIAERLKVEDALHESRQRLQILSQRLVDVQEEERRAIARELHDRVGQSLSALNINLVILDNHISKHVPEQMRIRLEDSIQLVAETIALVRDVMADLRPPVLDDYGLEAALQSHIDSFKSRYDIDVQFGKPDQPIPRLGASIEMTFLRIAQEALINVARHARAKQATLSLQQEEKAIRLVVQDNGVGITSWQDANRPGSHGLTIIRERAEAFGGDLKVTSVPGKGTRVEASIPIETGAPNKVEEESYE